MRLALLVLLSACAAAPEPPPEPASDPVLFLDPPIAGVAEQDWTVQNHVDLDPGTGIADWRGGRHTYDGHKGTDFRIRGLPAMVAGVEVRAPADGRVLRVRDGQPDRCAIIAEDEGPDEVACGNGLVIDHGGGFQSQLCHLRKGSVRVQADQEVRAGEALGLVGWSGWASFPHVHLTVRHDGTVLDPFSPAAEGPRVEWRTPETVPPASHRVWALSFAPTADLDLAAVDRAPRGAAVIAGDAEAIVAYAMALHNDIAPAWRMELTSPGGRLFEDEGAPKGTAQGLTFVGKRRREGERLEAGTWSARLWVGADPVREWSVQIVPDPVPVAEEVTWEGCAASP